MAESISFHWADYLVFGISLGVTLAIGVYFAFKDRNKASTDEFLMGGRSIHFLPVSMSILASLLNGVFVIGIPAEIYYFGPVYCLAAVGITLGAGVVVTLVFIPTFHKMNLTSAYEYFDRRYGFPPLRIAVSLTFIVNMLLFLAVVLYAPALAFSEVTGLSLVASILASGCVCTLYTALGGLKAVVWTDTLQMVIIFLGVTVLVIMGFYDDSLGGPGKVFDRVKEGNRMDFGVWDPDPRTRHTVWTQIIGHGVIWLSVFATNQMTVQRYLAVSSVRKAQYAMVLGVVASWILMILILLLAWVMYAYYYECDPMLSGAISKPDQIVPRFLMEILGDAHGLPGLFTAAVFAASLSSVSSALNSLSAVVLEDFVKPIYRRVKKVEISDKKATAVSRIASVVFGVATVGMSFCAEYMGDNLAEIPGTVWGAVSAPILGVFLLSMLLPWATGPGCLTGLLTSLTFTLWMAIGGVFYGKGRTPLAPLGRCVSDSDSILTTNSTSMMTTMGITETNPLQMTDGDVVPGPSDDDGPLQAFYDVSYTWYALSGVVVCVTVSIVTSAVHIALGGSSRRDKATKVDPSLMYNCADSCCCWRSRGGSRLEGENILQEKTENPSGGVQNPGLDTSPDSTRF